MILCVHVGEDWLPASDRSYFKWRRMSSRSTYHQGVLMWHLYSWFCQIPIHAVTVSLPMMCLCCYLHAKLLLCGVFKWYYWVHVLCTCVALTLCTKFTNSYMDHWTCCRSGFELKNFSKYCAFWSAMHCYEIVVSSLLISFACMLILRFHAVIDRGSTCINAMERLPCVSSYHAVLEMMDTQLIYSNSHHAYAVQNGLQPCMYRSGPF